MSTPRVFVVQRPTQRDDDGSIVPSMDLSPAKEHGELYYILREDQNPFTDPSATVRDIDRYFTDQLFGEDDYLLLVGNPILIALVAATAADYVPALRMLQWHRQQRRYNAVIAQLIQDPVAL